MQSLKLVIIFGLAFLLAPATSGDPRPASNGTGQIHELCTCDEVLTRECTATSWVPTGDATCRFSISCGFPWFKGYFVEKTRVITCTYRCWNGCTYVRDYPQTWWFQNGCCSGGPPYPGRQPEPEYRHDFNRFNPQPGCPNCKPDAENQREK